MSVNRLGMLIALLLSMISSAAFAENWPQYRGPGLNGQSSEKGWLTQWPKSGPEKIWTNKVGAGYSSMAVVDGKVYTMGNADGQDSVWCFEAATGTKVWSQSYACESASSYPGPRATPTVEGGKVYTYSRNGHLNCYQAADGSIKEPGALKCMEWKTGAVKWSAPQSFGALILVDGKLVILTPQGELVIAEASPEKYKELARAKVLDGVCWTDPVLSGGHIYVRNEAGDLVCLKVVK